MVLQVPAVPTFSMGSSAPPAAGSESKVDMSLDEMIKQRRKEQQSKSRKGAAGRAPSTADRVTGANKAKRAAAVKARRGMPSAGTKTGGTNNKTTTTKNKPKPSAMDVEREVYRQSRKTAKSKESSLRKKSGGRLPPSKDSLGRRQSQRVSETRGKTVAQQKQRNEQSKQVGNAIYTWTQGTRRPPSRKAVNAAVDAMQGAGFKVPQGMQMVISFAPAPEGKSPPPQLNKGKNGNNNNNKGKTNNRNRNNNNRGGRKN
mmetsp:Transcript_17342/g.24365  ORF Transcript_17342/g.24365 Transcript_17342/m.24365 type:complete len:258 (+) Transcript_17342:168-941(+)